MKRLFSALLIFTFILSGCEKDDICDELTPTTPRLIVSFYDISNPTVLKNVNSLLVTGEGMTEPLATFTAVSQIELPLKITDDVTAYRLVLNSNNVDFDNEDRIQFSYSREEFFVSRACGYKTVFTLDGTTPFTLSDSEPADGLWIQNITVATPDIENEDETHINIYF